MSTISKILRTQDKNEGRFTTLLRANIRHRIEQDNTLTYILKDVEHNITFEELVTLRHLLDSVYHEMVATDIYKGIFDTQVMNQIHRLLKGPSVTPLENTPNRAPEAP